MEKILFQTKTKYTLREYKKLMCTILKPNIFILCFLLFLIIVTSVIHPPVQVMENGNIDFTGFMAIVMTTIIVLIFWKIGFGIMVGWLYRSNVKHHNADAEYFFFEERMEESNNQGSDFVWYDKIHRILETGTHFYLMTSRYQGMIIVKKNCSPQCIGFIQNLKDGIKKNKKVRNSDSNSIYNSSKMSNDLQERSRVEWDNQNEIGGSEPQFQTRTTFTLDEYRKYVWAVQKSMKGILIVIVAIILLFAVENLLSKNTIQGIYGICMLILILATIFIAPKVGLKRQYETRFDLKDSQVVFSFYSDHLEEKSKRGCTVLRYDKIYRIIETNTNFYIMITKGQGMVIVKENCSCALISFIRILK